MTKINPQYGKVRSHNACEVKIRDGFQVVTMPDGTEIPQQIWSRVYNGVNEPSYAIVKVFVNIGDDSNSKPNTPVITETDQHADQHN